MKRTYTSSFQFACRGLISPEELYSHFYECFPHFMQGYLMGVVMVSNCVWTATVGMVKLRNIEFSGIEEKGHVSVKTQTTVNIEGREAPFVRGQDDEKIKTASQEVSRLVSLGSKFFQECYLNELPVDE